MGTMLAATVGCYPIDKLSENDLLNIIRDILMSNNNIIQKQEPKLRTLTVSPDDLIWNDRGSGAYADGSFWTYAENLGNYKLLGDTLCGQPNSHNSPCEKMMLVEDNGDGILAQPSGVTRIWTDAGSGADRDVAVFRLNPPKGYVCLGDIALGDYDNGDYPNLDRYRCVRHDFVDEAYVSTYSIWEDRGSGADRDFAGYDIEDTATTISVGLFHGDDNYQNYKYANTVYGLISSKLV